MKKSIKTVENCALLRRLRRLLVAVPLVRLRRKRLASSHCSNFELSFALINVFLILATISIIGFEVTMFTSAQEPPAEVFTRDESGICVTRLKAFMEIKRAEFGAFMNQHFQSSKPASELLPAAIERFRLYRKEIRAEMERFTPRERAENQAAISERTSCENAMDEDFTLMKDLIKDHIRQNALAKKSTRMLDKYKEINNKLERLNFTISQMYGYFGALSQKLPCYATKCIKG